VQVIAVERKPCMPARSQTAAQVLSVVKIRNGIAVSQAVKLVNAHFPSSNKQNLTDRQRASGFKGCTDLCGDNGIVMGDLNTVHPRAVSQAMQMIGAAWSFDFPHQKDTQPEPDMILRPVTLIPADSSDLKKLLRERYRSDAHSPIVFQWPDSNGRGDVWQRIEMLARTVNTACLPTLPSSKGLSGSAGSRLAQSQETALPNPKRHAPSPKNELPIAPKPQRPPPMPAGSSASTGQAKNNLPVLPAAASIEPRLSSYLQVCGRPA